MIDPPSNFWTSERRSRKAQKSARWASVSAMTTSRAVPSSKAPESPASTLARSPSGRPASTSSSAYQGVGFGERVSRPIHVRQLKLDPDARDEFEGADQAARRGLHVVQEADRGGGVGQCGERGLARPRQGPEFQDSRGYDAERALGAQRTEISDRTRYCPYKDL